MTTTTLEPRLLDPTVETWALEYPGRLSEGAIAEIYHQLEGALPGKRVVVVQEGGRFRPLASLDAAWAEAEAALSARADWWRIRSLTETAFAPMRWEVVATDGNRIVKADGHDPAAALRALAAALRERQP